MGIQKSNLNEQIIKNLLNKYYGIEIKEVEKLTGEQQIYSKSNQIAKFMF